MTVRALLVGGLSVAVSAAWVWAQAPEGTVLTPTPPAVSPSSGVPPAAPTYVGSTVCAQCHFKGSRAPEQPPRVGYIGVMGSRRTHERRLVRLREEGVTEAQLARVMAPIGLDIGARTPEETAISIVSEIIALRARRGAPSLRDGSGPIHG